MVITVKIYKFHTKVWQDKRQTTLYDIIMYTPRLSSNSSCIKRDMGIWGIMVSVIISMTLVLDTALFAMTTFISCPFWCCT